MHVKRITAQDFRRFRDLEIVNLPATAKLIVVAGPNGNGKSSLFDIFLRFKYRQLGFHGWNDPYHRRISDLASVPAPDRLNVEFHEEQLPLDWQKLFVACESGKKDGAPGEGFDADIYNTIFATEYREEMLKRVALNAPLLAPITPEKEQAYAMALSTSRSRTGSGGGPRNLAMNGKRSKAPRWASPHSTKPITPAQNRVSPIKCGSSGNP
jgi:hypothetical protein